MRFFVTVLALVLASPLSAADLSCATTTTARTYLAGGQSVDIGDFDVDGFLDVLTSNPYSVSLLYGRADGTLDAPIELGKSPSRSFGDVAAADMNGDGREDLLFVRSIPSSEIVVLHAAGNRSFEDPVIVPYSGAGISAKIEVADVTNDGRPVTSSRCTVRS